MLYKLFEVYFSTVPVKMKYIFYSILRAKINFLFSYNILYINVSES